MAKHRLFIANRGEIAVRIIRTASRLGIPTIAVFTSSEPLSLHVSLATVSVELSVREGQSEASAYLDIDQLISVAKENGSTLLHPGYGFLSENASFARAVREAGITFLGPNDDVIETMGLKHLARATAQKVGIPVLPGIEEDGPVTDIDQAVSAAREVGYPVILKASAGGGGMGTAVCNNEAELRSQFHATRARAKVLFDNEDVLLERYLPSAHHIEVQAGTDRLHLWPYLLTIHAQVFGNGNGKVVHMGERECSLQRRRQKVIEESPSPFLTDRRDLRNAICEASVRLCESVKYSSAGTVEFLVDDNSAEFFFLEMNTRIQVEHRVTEAVQDSLDLVELMILQGMREYEGSFLSDTSAHLSQDQYDNVSSSSVHAFEVRIYAENPAANFMPTQGVLQLVDFQSALNGVSGESLQIDTWVSTGTTITSSFDTLIAKVISTGLDRSRALEQASRALREVKVLGITTNVPYILELLEHPNIRAGRTTTDFLSTFTYTSAALSILHPGISITIQDLPGRPTLLHGIPPSGAMDPRAHSAANILCGNEPETEALEIISVRGAEARIKFWIDALIGVSGGHPGIQVRIDGEVKGDSWTRMLVPQGSVLELSEEPRGDRGGFRVYLAVQGGFPDIPKYLGSKSTSLNFGGYQGRLLRTGDEVALVKRQTSGSATSHELSRSLVPTYPRHWILRVVSGPHDDPEFLTHSGTEAFYRSTWSVSTSSSRAGIRLLPTSTDGPTIEWARTTGGEGGSHPSNILDNAYARGSINVSGDTPIILGCEGPDMGGYVCLCAIIQADLWKLGQLHPGCTVRFERVTWSTARHLRAESELWLAKVLKENNLERDVPELKPVVATEAGDDKKVRTDPKLFVSVNISRPAVIFRQAGDSAILVEFGPMVLDFSVRARVHVFESKLRERNIPGVTGASSCIRSMMCYYNILEISQSELLALLIDVERELPTSVKDMEFPGRRITLPIVLDDQWNRAALDRYIRTTRDKAVYLPSNIEYLANNNGLESPEEALAKLIGSDWLVFGVGFYVACPFLVAVDPRCRLVGQKMNPSRTFTPRGAIGIAGLVAAIYPVESPGGYQLYGRTIPGWHTWGKGKGFSEERPWLLNPFDQIRFARISETEYERLEKDFDVGRYEFKIEDCAFSMSEYQKFVEGMKSEIQAFRERQAIAVSREEAREKLLLKEWEEGQKAAKSGEVGAMDPGELVGEDAAAGGVHRILAPVSAVIYKIKCSVGDIIRSADDELVILELMKTEFPVCAGPDNVCWTVSAYGEGVKEGAVVDVGDVLVVFGNPKC